MRHTIFIAASFAAAALFAAPAGAGIAEDCEQTYDNELSIRGCTAVIRSGDYTTAGVAAAHNNRATAYRALGDNARALDDYNEALRLDPDHINAYNGRGNVYSDMGNAARAIEDYNRALELDPGYVLAYNGRGAANDDLGEYWVAIDNYDEALRLDPEYATAAFNRGNSYDNLGKYKLAIKSYDLALRLDPGYASAYRNRGISYENMGEFRLAAEDWEREIQAGGRENTLWWQEYLKSKGHYDGAIDGIYGPKTRFGLLACAVDPGC
jgi:tetratricopeptide (TPR) repeat protein